MGGKSGLRSRAEETGGRGRWADERSGRATCHGLEELCWQSGKYHFDFKGGSWVLEVCKDKSKKKTPLAMAPTDLIDFT